MRTKYKIDVNALIEYIKYLNAFKRETEKSLADFIKKLNAAHAGWNDINYDRTSAATQAIEDEIKKLGVALDDAIKSVKTMTGKYSDYLNRRR